MGLYGPQRECIEQAFRGTDVDGRRLAKVLADAGELEHVGTVSVIGDLTAKDSGYAPYETHLNTMPAPRGIHRLIGTDGPNAGDNGEDGAVLLLNNVPAGGLPLANLHGDGGFALRIPNGVLWNQGESWVLKPGRVQSVGTLEDERAYSLPSGVDSTYYYADTYNCGDSKGRNETREPVRVFSANSIPTSMVGKIVHYLRDQNGVAWIVDATSPSPYVAPYAIATDDWDWVSGYDGQVGYAIFREANDVFGDTAGADATTYSVYLRATAGQDPNIHVGDVVTYRVDAGSNKVADSGYLDAKINTIERWYGTTMDIKAGWIAHTAEAGRFIVGYDPLDPDYDGIGETGGSHPIRPAQHSSGTAAWAIDDHAFTTSTSTAGITINSSVTAISVNDHAAKSTGGKAGLPDNHTDPTGSGAANISNHSSGDIGNHSTTDVVAIFQNHDITEHALGSGTAQVPVTSPTSHIQLHDDLVHAATSTAAALGHNTLTHLDTGHTHPLSLTHSGGSHTHSIDAYSHSLTDGGHTHGVTQTPHSHTATLTHTGTLAHAEEDFRPPYKTVLFVRRVHPDQE